MDADTFADRWQRNPSEVLKHLCKKREGELVELEGWWEIGTEESPQMSCSTHSSLPTKQTSGASMDRSRYSADYHRGKSKGKGKPAGRAGKGPAVGEPALGGKGKSIMTRGKQFTSNVVRLSPDGTWHFRRGTCMSLAHLFAKLGEHWTAAKLYQYYNLSRVFACKRENAWSNPVRRAAATERYRETGWYGHGR